MDSIYQVAQDYFQHRRENTSLSDQYFVDRLRNMGKNEDSCVLIMEELEFDWKKLLKEEHEIKTHKKNAIMGLILSVLLCVVVLAISVKGQRFFQNGILVKSSSVALAFILMLESSKKYRQTIKSQKRRNQKWEDWT